MLSLFSDCFSLLFIPDISKWNNYNCDDLNDIRDYKRIDNILNFPYDFHKQIFNQVSYIQELEDKINEFL